MKLIKILIVIMALMATNHSEAQIWKKLTKKAGEKATEVAVKKASKQTEKTINDVIDGKRKKKKRQEDGQIVESNTEEPIATEKLNGGLKMFTKFDFVSGDSVLFYDDFSIDNIGDFPSKWDTDGTGELVEVLDRKWLKLSRKSNYLPLFDEKLPENYTIEFDLMLTNYPANKGGVGGRFWICLDESDAYKFEGKNRVEVSVGFWTAIINQVWINNRVNGKRAISNNIHHDLHDQFNQTARISVAVSKRRFRMWVNRIKIVDVPRLVPEVQLSKIKLHTNGYPDELLISDFKLATGNRDIREELITNGSFSTNAIQFDSGSAKIKPVSYGILKQIGNAIQKDNFKIHIVGHTDDTGDETTNMQLSQERAQAVKEALVSSFEIDETLLSIEGKGETSPVADNTTAEGRAQNRRVDFIKL